MGKNTDLILCITYKKLKTSSFGSEFSDLFNTDAQNFMTVSCSSKTDFIGFACFPVIVKISKPSVYLQIVKSHVGNHFLLNDWAVSSGSNSILIAESFKLFVSWKAVFDRLRNLVTETFDQVDKTQEIRNWAFGSFFEYFTNENDDFVSSGIIDAWNNRCWVREFILLEKSIECCLKDLFVRDVRNWRLWAFEYFMSISSTLKSKLVVFTSKPIVVKKNWLFMNFSVVEDGIGSNFLLDSGWVSSWIDAVDLSKGGQFSIRAQAVSNWFGEVRDKLFRKSDNVEKVANWTSCRFGEDLSSEFNNFMSSLIIKAINNGGRSFEFVLIKKSIKTLLHDFFVGKGIDNGKQSEKY